MRTTNAPGAIVPPRSARGPQHGRVPRASVVLGAVVAAALLAGCGGTSQGASTRTNTPQAASATAARSRTANSSTTSFTTSKTSAKPPTEPSMLAFAKCMRAHGVPNFPDPKPRGQIPTTHTTQPAPGGGFTADPNSPVYQTASNDCRSLADASPVTQGEPNQIMASQLKFAVCMRAHSVPNFPDPTSTGEIGNDGAISGVNQNSPAFQRAEQTCSQFLSLPPVPRGGSSGATAGGG
jgi:hypothetical protein